MAFFRSRLFQAAGVVVVPLLIFLYAWRANLPQHAGFQENRTTELDPKKQKQIWDNEHITFEIERRFGSIFMAALLAEDKSRLETLFRSGFHGKINIVGRQSTKDLKYIAETKTTGGKDTQDTGADEITTRLLTIRARFQRVERKLLRVLQIKQTSQDPPQWQIQLLLGLSGVDDKEKPLQYESLQRVGFTITDEKKMAQSPVLDSWHVEQETWRHGRDYLMEDITASAGLAKLPIPDNWNLPHSAALQYRFQVAVADYNKDGFLDIAVAVLDGQPLLLESKKGKRFHDVAHDRRLAPLVATAKDLFVAAWIDYDNDGWPDLLINGRLFRNVEGKHFVEVTTQSGLRFWPECMGVTTADYDSDGKVDLYFLYQKDYDNRNRQVQTKWVDEQETGKENQLWRNLGNGRFQDVTAASGAGGGKRHTFAAAWYFHDDDHHPDLYIANDFGKNVVLRNRGNGTFEDVSSRSGAEDYATSMGVTTGDIDNDGRADIYVANMFSKMGRRIIGQLEDGDYPPGVYEQIKGACAGNRLYLRKGGARYRDFSEEMGVNGVGWAFAPALFDMDGDGWLDIYAATGFMSFKRNEPDG